MLKLKTLIQGSIQDYSSHNNNGIFTKGSSSGFKNTSRGLALEFDGTASLVNLTTTPFTFAGETAITVSAWIKTDDISASRAVLWENKDSTNNAYRVGLYLTYAGTYKLAFAVSADSDTAVTFSMETNKWYHIVGTYDGTTISLYANGALISSTGLTGAIDSSSGSYDGMALGCRVSGASKGYYWDGQIANVQIYDEAINANKRASLYQKFLDAKQIAYTKRNFQLPVATDLSKEVENGFGSELVTNGSFTTDTDWDKTETWVIGSGYATGTGNSASQYIQQDLGVLQGRKYLFTYRIIENTLNGTGASLSSSGQFGSVAISSVIGVHSVEITAGADASPYDFKLGISSSATTGTISIDDISVREVTGLVCAYNTTRSGSTLIDVSGNGHNATLTGTPLQTLKGYDYNGTTDHAVIPDSNALSFGNGTADSPFSVSAWVNMDDATSFNIINKGIYNSTGEYQFYIDSADLLKIKLFDESVDSCYVGRYYSDAMTRYEGILTHIVATYNGVGGATASSGCKMYVNGIQVDDINSQNNQASYVAMENLTHDVWLGRYNVNYANGQIGETRIYNKELSAQEVKDAYNAKIIPSLRETFKDISADGKATLNPRGWIDGTGTYVGDQHFVEFGELITNGGFDTDSDWAKETDWTISDGTANLNTTTINRKINQTILTIGKRYSVSFDVVNYVAGRAFYRSGSTIHKTIIGNGTLTDTFVAEGTLFYIGNDIATSEFSIDNVSVTEIDYEGTDYTPIKHKDKYLKCTSAGTKITQSTQAYGTWEWDMKKGADGNANKCFFIADRIGASQATQGYYFVLDINEEIYFLRTNVGSYNILLETATGYFNNNQWYHIKITRTPDGEFTVWLDGELVDITGGSGTNPCTDNTYTTSQYCVLDLDGTGSADDCIANFKFTKFIEQ